MKTSLTLSIAFALALVATGSVRTATNPIEVQPQPQTITICKKTSPPGGTGFPFSWTVGSTGTPTSFQLNDAQCTVKNITGLDHYNQFTENVPAGWSLTNISCNNTTSPVKIIGANANPGFQPGDNTVTIDLNEANVTCTFTNQRRPACCDWRLDLSTGQGSSSIDPGWKINNANAYIISNLGVLSGTWMVLPPARWIQLTNYPKPAGAAVGTYKYTIKFNVPDCRGSRVQLTGSFAADNGGTAYLDNNPIPGASCAGPTCFNSTQAPVSLNGAPVITPGAHTLQIDVKNTGSAPTYSGLIVNARLTRTCP